MANNTPFSSTFSPRNFNGALTYSGGIPGGVPEPASWALMIGGFGLVGASMRRRRDGLYRGLIRRAFSNP